MPYTFKQALERVTNQKAHGPSATFSVFHLVRALELIAEKKVGRSKLAEDLGIGEGAMRTIVGRLKEADLISTSKIGCSLTSKGLKLWEDYESKVRKIEICRSELGLGKHNFAILVRNGGAMIKSGIEQRDAAVVVGAKSAITMMVKGDRLVIPSVSGNVSEDFPEAANQLLELLKPNENDAIVIASADTLEKAEYGALAAAWTLLDGY